MEPKAPAFVVNGREYPVPSSFSIGEMCDAERYFGVEFGENTSSGMRMAAALLWIAIRREDATVTVDDIRALPPEVFSASLEDDARPPETESTSNESPVSNGSSGDVSSVVLGPHPQPGPAGSKSGPARNPSGSPR